MEWTRRPLLRMAALTASAALVVIHGDGRGPWFWVGVVLVVLNAIGLLAARSRAGGGDEGLAGSRSAGDLERRREDGRSHHLGELRSLPGVAAALAAGPQVWHQVSYRSDIRLEPATAEELSAFVYIEYHDGWEIGLGDEVKPYVDLDIDEMDDPMIHVLESHPAVQRAVHEDREVYRVAQGQPINIEDLAELVARGLVAHHVHAAARS